MLYRDSTLNLIRKASNGCTCVRVNVKGTLNRSDQAQNPSFKVEHQLVNFIIQSPLFNQSEHGSTSWALLRVHASLITLRTGVPKYGSLPPPYTTTGLANWAVLRAARLLFQLYTAHNTRISLSKPSSGHISHSRDPPVLKSRRSPSRRAFPFSAIFHILLGDHSPTAHARYQ